MTEPVDTSESAVKQLATGMLLNGRRDVHDMLLALAAERDVLAKQAQALSNGLPVDQPVVYGVIVTSNEAKSGARGNPVMTKEDERFWATVEPEGWVEASSVRYGDGVVPGDPLTFPTQERAEAFAKRWKGHPWWCVPNGQYEIVPLVARTVTDSRITGLARAIDKARGA